MTDTARRDRPRAPRRRVWHVIGAVVGGIAIVACVVLYLWVGVGGF